MLTYFFSPTCSDFFSSPTPDPPYAESSCQRTAEERLLLLQMSGPSLCHFFEEVTTACTKDLYLCFGDEVAQMAKAQLLKYYVDKYRKVGSWL